MEYLSSLNLREHLIARERQIGIHISQQQIDAKIKDAIRVCRQIAKGLHYLEQQSVNNIKLRFDNDAR